MPKKSVTKVTSSIYIYIYLHTIFIGKWLKRLTNYESSCGWSFCWLPNRLTIYLFHLYNDLKCNYWLEKTTWWYWCFAFCPVFRARLCKSVVTIMLATPLLVFCWCYLHKSDCGQLNKKEKNDFYCLVACGLWGVWRPRVCATFWHAGFHYSLWMWQQSATAGGGGEGGGDEEQIPTAFPHHLYSCQWPKTPSHYCAANSSASFLEN